MFCQSYVLVPIKGEFVHYFLANEKGITYLLVHVWDTAPLPQKTAEEVDNQHPMFFPNLMQTVWAL